MMICATATKGASSWMYSPASAPNDAISISTLYIGLRWPMTSADARIAIPERPQKISVSGITGTAFQQLDRPLRCRGRHIRGRRDVVTHSASVDPARKIKHQRGGDDEADHGGREEPLPAELDQLVVAI